LTVAIRIARYGMRDVIRSRWLLAYGAFFLIATHALLRFSDTPAKALLSLVNVVLLVVPLANVVFGTAYLYASREFVELLLAQPVRRRQLFAGQCLGLAAPVAAAAVAGILVPLLANGVDAAALRLGAVIALMATALSLIFTALAAVVAYGIEDRVRGLALAIGLWLLLAVVYDGAVLLAAVQFADYPLERPMLGAMMANPIDLARVLLLTRFDTAALLGYTGAVFQRLFAGTGGLAIAAGALLLWVAVPTVLGARLFHRKDF
jgi:Cu-processing system permease protein